MGKNETEEKVSHDNIDKGAHEIAELLKRGNVGAVESRLRDDIRYMTSESLNELFKKVEQYQDPAGLNKLELVDGDRTLQLKHSYVSTNFLGLRDLLSSTTVESDFNGVAWSNVPFKDSRGRTYRIGAPGGCNDYGAHCPKPKPRFVEEEGNYTPD